MEELIANRENAFMREAIALSMEAAHGSAGGPFGAVVVRDGRVVGRGSNSVLALNDPTAHAEIQAIREACRHLRVPDLEGCELFTSCEPCPMCLAASQWARIDTIFYGNTREDAAAIGFADAMIYRAVAGETIAGLKKKRLLPEEAHLVFDSWNLRGDRPHYGPRAD